MNSIDVGVTALTWRSRLSPWDDRRTPDRGAIARLRRSSTINEALGEQETHRLIRMVKPHDADVPALVSVAIILAHVRGHDGGRKIAPRLGDSSITGKPLLSSLRFKRLLVATDIADALMQFRRLIPILGTQTNVVDLAASIYDWADDRRGADRRYRWMLAFHGAIEDARDDETATETA